jgi:hypothetical protein
MITEEYLKREFDGVPNAIENSFKTMLNNLNTKEEGITKLIFSNEVDQASLTIFEIQGKDFDLYVQRHDAKYRK